ncbi:amidase [Cobetia sp. 10Alg 146]|uniref:amidase n=1 Tax=Cobetia sp. 10Alg 146 TaxID=3040019 RepID=UPI002446B162|nr:amidase [Cobetia sp. 10Alg 146]MDH2291379.1 amidase [Cobetia sp. 10Alg 146]
MSDEGMSAERVKMDNAREFWARSPRQRTLTQLLAAYQAGSFGPEQTATVLAERHQALGETASHSIISRDDAVMSAQAAAQQQLKAAATSLPLGGVPVSIKDLFDEAGMTTMAGSRALAESHPASQDAPALARLKAAGILHAGRTSMSEFAFSGLGLNPHVGTPPNPFDGERITGGSTSGGAASVAFGLAAATLGSDTGGSLRIPAAFCGLTGFKPSQASVPGDGAFPLSPSLDCIGPIAPSVACCRTLWEVLSGEVADPTPLTRPLTLLVPESELVSEVDADVAADFAALLERLEGLGVRLQRAPVEAIEAAYAINQRGGLVIPEAAAVHHELLAAHEDQYDPLIAERLNGGRDITASEYLARLWPRTAIQQRFAQQVQDVDAVLMPTVAMRAPRRDLLEQDGALFAQLNKRALRNTSVFNYLDASSISIPAPAPQNKEPLGLMLSRPQGQDVALLRVAQALETLLAR